MAIDPVTRDEPAQARRDDIRAARPYLLSALPFRSFPVGRVDATFRLMAQGKHIGKVVVAFSESFINRRGEMPAVVRSGREGVRLLIADGVAIAGHGHRA